VFRLNLYPEAEEKRRAEIKRAGSTALVTFLVATALVLTAFHAGSGLLLAERARGIAAKAERRQVDALAQPTAQTSAELARYRAVVELRSERVVWAPKLAELGRSVRWPLAITQVAIAERSRGQTVAGLRIEGSVPPDRRGDADGLIASLVDTLKKSPTFLTGLSGIEIASVSFDKHSGATNFQIVCPIIQSASEEEGVSPQEDITLRPGRGSGNP
jgi:hypothetical protein